MMMKEKWVALSEWSERLPFWQAIVLVPLLTPPLDVAAVAFLCHKTTTPCVLFLTLVYCYIL